MMHILSHANIPKPMHGVNPRNIMGKVEWDKLRNETYSSANYCCKSCGIHKSNAKKHSWLEAHEEYEIDYAKRLVIVSSIVPLCHYCHSFIHSGLLKTKYCSQKISLIETMDILAHGIDILHKNNAPIFIGTKIFAHEVGIDTFGLKLVIPKKTKWDGWSMIWKGKPYPSKFKNFKEWNIEYGINK